MCVCVCVYPIDIRIPTICDYVTLCTWTFTSAFHPLRPALSVRYESDHRTQSLATNLAFLFPDDGRLYRVQCTPPPSLFLLFTTSHSLSLSLSFSLYVYIYLFIYITCFTPPQPIIPSPPDRKPISRWRPDNNLSGLPFILYWQMPFCLSPER